MCESVAFEWNESVLDNLNSLVKSDFDSLSGHVNFQQKCINSLNESAASH